MNDSPSILDAIVAAWPRENWQDVRVVVGVSGGADSVALLRCLHALHPRRTNLHVAHFNHRWRDNTSDDDEQFVRTLARQLEIDVHVGRPNVDPIAAERTESHAREQRWSFLERIANELGARYIVTAHTADDQAETVLHRILRGTGFHGLRGIQTTRRLNRLTTIVRPLLNVSRTTILQHLAEINQPYCDDESNHDETFTRARIRHNLLPHLQRDYNANVNAALVRLASQAADAHDAIIEQVDKLTTAHVVSETSDRVVVESTGLQHVSSYLIREMFAAIWRRNHWPLQRMSYDNWVELSQLTMADVSMKLDLPDGLRVERSKNGQVVVTRQNNSRG